VGVMAKKKEVVKIPQFIGSGSSLLNLALSGKVDGGWRIGRVANIVGDKSTGKTLLATEAITYALKVLGSKFKVKAVYDETESAFDIPYAVDLGMPVKDVDFRQSTTVEDWYESLNKLLDEDDYDFMIYVLDSLDALSSRAEDDTPFDKGTFSLSKPKKIGELFRKLNKKVEKKNVLILIVSQIRDKIGVVFGETKTRAGGRAMDFYNSQILWLAETGRLKIANRVMGVTIRAKVKKNKVWKPYREADFPILFEYGVDDVGSMVDFLIDNKVIEKSGKRYLWEDSKL
jgi:recombination protein RecA